MAAGSSGWALDYYDSVFNFDLERLKFIVQHHGVDLNANFTQVRKKYQYHLDQSPIHLAVQTEEPHFKEMLQYLYDMKCDIQQMTATLRRTPLHFAVLWCNAPCVEKLVELGSKPDPRDNFGNSPCHYAAEIGSCDILEILLHRRPNDIDINAQDIALKTALMKATRNREIAAVKRLLEEGCSVNLADANKDTALHFAVRNGSDTLSDILLSSRSDINARNQWGHTPLIEAVCYNNKDTCLQLLEAVCLVNVQELKGGNSALHFAVQKNYNTMVDQLLSTGRIEQVRNNQGESPIYEAVRSQRLETIKIFLKHNHDLTVPILTGSGGTPSKTAVQVCMERGNFEVLRLLASVGFLLSTTSQLHGTNISINPDQASAFEKFFDEVLPVRPLKQMVRLLIRIRLGFGIQEKVLDLPIPQQLKDYILLQDIL